MYRKYTRTLDMTSVPTKETLEETYKAYKAENMKDAVIMLLLHKFAMRKLRSGFIDRPGSYKLTIRVKFPIMFWHKIRYTIEQL